MQPKEIFTVKDRRSEKQEFAKHLGEHLRKMREAKGVSQEKLALDCGYYRTYVNKIEMGSYSPSMHTMWRLSNGLGMTLSEFYKDF